MTRTRQCLAASVLSLGVVAPAAAERLVFEGMFDAFTECGFTGRHECSEQAAVDVPFTFTVNVLPGVVQNSQALVQTGGYAPPFLTPQLVHNRIAPTAEEFAVLVERLRNVTTTYFTAPAGSGLRWDFNITHSWSGIQPITGGIPNLFWAQEGLSLSLMGDTGRTGTSPPSFAELVRLFDNVVASATPVTVTAGGFRIVSEQDNPTGAAETSTSLTGAFRLVAVQCRTPVGMLGRLRSTLGG